MNAIKSIIQFHRLASLPDPLHPLVSIIHVEDIRLAKDALWERFYLDFYTISLKRNVQAKAKYGQQSYDFDKGLMSFTAPKQLQSHEKVDSSEINKDLGTGYVLLLHPGLLGKHPLAVAIKTYGFFDYAVHEALHLSEKEERNIIDLFLKIEEEYQHIDPYTQDIVLAQVDVLLRYCRRFYERQFITRKTGSNDLLSRTEQLLNAYFDKEESLRQGLPTVDYLANELHLSPHYFSDMLRSLTGQSAQQHIHQKLIDKAKEYLSVTDLSVAEIAYRLGFEYPQSFNKLFKSKTDQSPLEFRASFN
ncbi:helix-turn-helix domain-containing protein [Spirosoma pollinicola]|uniref:AraC family transcriptional regulator n=1 Tax=Spirosoma pollinicola TaxID=2057025 RepID=A0A2K8Z9Y9_9BACT|nr:helix-turn-helix transcriptional regulator [Spirosoma pollinicola]AUD06664.1 AraC family transcriptional regulator [Spirosoma pollinicola]